MSLPPKSDNDESAPQDAEVKPRARRTTRTTSAAAAPKRLRTRKPRGAGKDDSSESATVPETGDLFSSSSNEPSAPSPASEQAPAAASTEGSAPRTPRGRSPRTPSNQAPAEQGTERSSAPVASQAPAPRAERESPVEQSPVEPTSKSASQSGHDNASQHTANSAPESAHSTGPEGESRSVFVPSAKQDQSSEADSAGANAAPAEQAAEQSNNTSAEGEQRQGNGGGGNAHEGRPVKDRNYWKQLKKDKKKWKQDQRQQGGGHGGGRQHHQQHGQHTQHEKPPQQPPPPNFVQHSGSIPNAARFEDQVALDALAAEMLAQSTGEPILLDQLYDGTLAELSSLARELGVNMEGAPPPRRILLSKILAKAAEHKRSIRDRGWLDLTDKGYGFIVHPSVNYRLYPENSYIAPSLVTRFGLKRGHEVEVLVSAPEGEDSCCSAVQICSVMGKQPDALATVLPFEELIPYYPLKRILVEANEVHVKDVSMRAVDILTPIGFGQRGLIVAPPRTGKTVLLHNIANSISENCPEAKLLILLVDERPEEVTDFKRHTRGEVISSTFDEMPENHVHAAEMVSEKAKRLVEQGEHVIILLDSITRLARAYNALASNSGKIMSGGIEATALQKPKRFFGAARNIEGGGSLTILGTALIDTGSRMDEVIFEEFKGTGNMELHLDRGLSDKRIFPAINIDRSGTRKEELIYHPDELQRIYSLRRAMQGLGPIESMDMLIQRLKKTRSNTEFLIGLSRT